MPVILISLIVIALTWWAFKIYRRESRSDKVDEQILDAKKDIQIAQKVKELDKLQDKLESERVDSQQTKEGDK